VRLTLADFLRHSFAPLQAPISAASTRVRGLQRSMSLNAAPRARAPSARVQANEHEITTGWSWSGA